MFEFTKSDPANKLIQKHESLLESAIEAQRGGDIRCYSVLMEQAEIVREQIDEHFTSSSQ